MEFLILSLYIILGLLIIFFSAIVIFLKKINYFYTFFHKIDKESSHHGGELVADVLKAHGVKFLFTLTGGHISPILVASEKAGIRVIDTRHEVTSVFAADAVARLTGTVGVAAVTAGPGLTNTITAIKNAQMAESPILLIGGAAATLLKNRGALQDIDQMCLLKPLCKYTATIGKLRDIKPTLREAIKIAQSGTPGPVFVEFPIDTLYPYQLVSQEAGISQIQGKGLINKLIRFYLENHLKNLFAGAFEKSLVDPLPVSIDKPNTKQIQQCIELVSKAKKPIIVIGSQATLPPVPVEKLRASLESIGFPCFLGGMSRGLLGRNSPLQMRQCRKEALKEADLVILAGTVCDFRLSYGKVLSRKSKIIAINRSKSQLYKNSDIFWSPTLTINSDVASVLVKISENLSGFKCDPDWINYLRIKDKTKEEANYAKGKHATDVHLNPIKILHCLEEFMSDNSILVADGGDFVGTAAYILRPRSPLSWLDPGAFGTLGVGGGFALGAKLCRPDHDVWIIYGDGSLGYSVAEFDTFTRHKIPIIALVGNDACWSQIARDQVRIFGHWTACNLAFCDYVQVAVGYGGVGYNIDRSNEEQMVEIFKKAVKDSSTTEGKSVLLNCYIGKTDFREGSISV